MRAAPVQEVAIEAVGSETREGSLAGGDGSAAGRVRRQHFRNQEDFVAEAFDGFGDPLFGSSGEIHFRVVDMGHAEIDAAAKGGYGAVVVAAIRVPGPLADDGDLP